MFKTRKLLMAGAALGAVLTAGGSALAQTKGAPAQDQGASGEVVVTAFKRPELLSKVPLSITAVDAKKLDDMHITDASQLVFAAPSLQVQSNNASPVASFFSIRGIGTLAFVKFIEQSVGVGLDGVALVRPETGVLAFYDINDVEVLNGPQGMLFGKNASAGLINITTKNPVLNQFNGYVTGEYGNMNTPGSGNEYQVQGVVNIPVTDTSALRITGVYLHTDPLVKDLYTRSGEDYDHTEAGARVKYLWRPNDALSINLTADYAVSDGVGAGETVDRSVAPGGYNATLDMLAGVTPGPKNVYNSSDAESKDKFQTGGLLANVSYSLSSGGTITNLLAWRAYAERGTTDNDSHQTDVENYLHGESNFSQVSDELRYSSAVGKTFDYQVGLYAITARTSGHALIFANAGLGAPPPPFVAFLGANGYDTEHNDSVAVFGQATYHITDKFRILAGARYTHDSVDNAGEVVGTDALLQVITPGVIPKSTVDNDDISWRTSAQYDFTSKIMGYVTIARGYKGPGFNQFSPLSVPAETSYQYEAGVKGKLFDNKVTLSLAVYDEIFDHFQDQTYFPVAPYYAVLSAGRLDSRGFEAQADWRVAKGLTLGANLAYVDAYFGSFPGDQCYAGEPAGTDASRNVCFNGHSNSSGNTLANAPKWTSSLTADYVRPVFSGYQMTFDGSLYLRTKVNYASDNNPNTQEGGYTLLGLNLGIGPEDGNWKATVFCRNCFDRRFVTYIEPYPFIATDYGQQYSPDSFRTVGVTVRKNF